MLIKKYKTKLFLATKLRIICIKCGFRKSACFKLQLRLKLNFSSPKFQMSNNHASKQNIFHFSRILRTALFFIEGTC